MKTYFSTRGKTATDVVTEVLTDVANRPAGEEICLHVMAFSFTDRAIAEALLDLCARRPQTRLRLLSDWGQLRHEPSVIPGMVDAAPPNVEFRFTADQPYLWDERHRRLRWSYHASRGFLHHKALIVLSDGQPDRLLCGSANWTKTASRSYENTLVLSAEDRNEADAIARFALEFESLWCDGRLTLSAPEAVAYEASIRGRFEMEAPNATGPRNTTFRFSDGKLDRLDWTFTAPGTGDEPPLSSAAHLEIAFSARREGREQRFGYAQANHERRLLLASPSGRRKSRPFSVTSMALAVIIAARPGESLWLAMYGLSPRVAEYGALLDAARFGVFVRALLDARVGGETATRLRHQARREDLPVEVRTCNRIMHQKYIVRPGSGELATGTANMSTDSSLRHAEHRMLIVRSPSLASAFADDFDRIWTAPHVAV